MQNKNIFYNTKIKCTVTNAILNYAVTTKVWKSRHVHTFFYGTSPLTDNKVVRDKTLPLIKPVPLV